MRKLNNKKSIILSLIALTLIIVMAAGITFSWIEGGNKGFVNGNNLTISTGSNLTMRQDGEITSSIIVPACVLEEVSSADGRNFFFPLGGNKSSTTEFMKFREGIPSDENSKYISVDFQLEAGDTATPVYLGAGTIVQCENPKLMNALRMSFSKNNGETPLVFKPNQMPGISMDYSPISTIAADGVPTLTNVDTLAYGDYYYKGDNNSEHLFYLDKNETINVTMSVWLEGTAFEGDDIKNSNLSIYVDFTTTVDDLVKYNFIDNCHNRDNAKLNQWVSNNMEQGDVKYKTMMYIYDTTAKRYYAMEKTEDHKWEAYVPDTIRSFYFRRYSIDINEWWNEWEPDMENIPVVNNERTYVAICGQVDSDGTNLDGCYGYWKDETDTIRIYFQLETSAWDNLHCYAWGANNYHPLGAYPGSVMEHSHNAGSSTGTTEETKPVYYVDIEGASKLTGILFNNGSGSDDTKKYQIEDTQYFYNGFAMWFKSTASGNNGKFTYVKEDDSLIYPKNDPTP